MKPDELATKQLDDIKVFQNDTIKLGNCTTEFIEQFFPSYGIDNEMAVHTEQENSLKLLNSFAFYRICECTIHNIDDKMAFFSEKMLKLFTTAYSIKQEVCYGIVSNHGKTALVLGVAPNSEDETIKVIIEGLLPGIKIETYQERFENTKTGNVEDDRYVGCICGVPSLKIDGQLQHKELSSLMRSLNGQNYTIMVLCKPLDEYAIQEKINQAIRIQDECFAIFKRTVSLQKGDSQGITNTTSGSETNGENRNSTSGVNVSAALPGMAIGAKIGAIAGSVVPGVGNVVGTIGGGLIGLVVGKQLSFNKSSSKGTSHSITKGYSDAVTSTISNSESISGDVQNGFALELMKMAESMTERLKIGRSIGMWDSVVSFSSNSKMASEIIQGSLYSEMASGIPDVLPPVAFSYKDSCSDVKPSEGKIHNQQLMVPKGFFETSYKRDLCSMVTSEEICGICTIPTDPTVGFEIKESKGYSLNYDYSSSDIALGCVCEYDRPLNNVPFGLSEYDLNKHTFVCGITGSGKTNTVKKILENVNRPFLVIEPAKKEYRNINKETAVYTFGRPEINCMKINPFYILPGISPQQHIDLLKDLFSASFAFYGPMPYILEKCIYNIYTKKGWNLTLGFHPGLVNAKNQHELFDEKVISELYAVKAHKYVFPTMQDLKDEIDFYIENEMTYEGEVKGNIRGAIKARIDSLCVGSKGYMFNTHDMVDTDKLLNSNAVIELEGLADDSDKAFALGLLIIYVNEYRQVRKEIDGAHGLQHLLVIEEAHRLLKNVSSENKEDLGNPKGKAVEHFTNMLAEMRSYGQGVIVAEQIPSKLAPDIIKNSSNKIIHRIIAKDDQEIIANTIGVRADDAIYLGNSKVGYGLCHKEGMVQPVIVKIDEVKSKHINDVRLYNQDIGEKMFRINQSIIHNQLPESISVWAIKVLNSLLYFPTEKDIYEGLQFAYEQLEYLTTLKSITLIPGVEKKACVIQCISDNILSMMISGSYSTRKLPSDKLVDLLKNVLVLPNRDRLTLLSKELEAFYGKKTSKKAIETVAALLSKEYTEGIDISKAAGDFLLVEDMSFSRDVIQYLEREMKSYGSC